jgi:hypothetical protein
MNFIAWQMRLLFILGMYAKRLKPCEVTELSLRFHIIIYCQKYNTI